MKKLWQTPELIVLMRGKPEETVLTTCKSLAPTFIWPGATDTGCYENPGTGCQPCSVVSFS